MNIMSLLTTFSLTIPHPGVISQRQTNTHNAIDIVCMVGDKIIAAHNGKVEYHRDIHLGKVVTVENEEFRSVYAHLSEVSKVSQVKQGEIIGYCGNTGQWTTGAHLHFEIYETHVLD